MLQRRVLPFLFFRISFPIFCPDLYFSFFSFFFYAFRNEFFISSKRDAQQCCAFYLMLRRPCYSPDDQVRPGFTHGIAIIFCHFSPFLFVIEAWARYFLQRCL